MKLTMRPLGTAALLSATGLNLLTGCGSTVVGTTDIGYDGSLYAPDARWGAAGQVVDCDLRGVRGGNNAGSLYDNGEAADSPEAALEVAMSESGIDGVTSGYTEARAEDGRVLFAYERDDSIKQAVVVRDGPTLGGEGWYVESWARCDLAELPIAIAESQGLQIWTDEDDNPVSTRDVSAWEGPEHCDWEEMTFLYLNSDLEHAYVRNPDAELIEDFFSEDYRADIALPADAVDTGYRRGGETLWLSADGARAYVGDDPKAVEAWPRTTQRLGCA